MWETESAFMKKNSTNQFKLEALEPRLLLSGTNAIDSAPLNDFENDPVIDETLKTSEVAASEQSIYSFDSTLGLADVFALDDQNTQNQDQTISPIETPASPSESDIQPESNNIISEANRESEETRAEVPVSKDGPRWTDNSSDMALLSTTEVNKTITDIRVETLLAANGPPVGEGQTVTSPLIKTKASDNFSTFKEVLSTSGQEGNLKDVLSSAAKNSSDKFEFFPEFNANSSIGTIYSPGHSPGIETFDTFSKTSADTVLIEIGGTSPGAGNNNHDQIQVTGKATLAGTLHIDLWNNFTPQIGQTFTILTYGSVEGDFDKFESLDLGNGLIFQPQLGATVYQLFVNSKHLLPGNPSNATTDTSNKTNYLLNRLQYSLSFNNDIHQANWVAWELDNSWLGTLDGKSNYPADPLLPAGFSALPDSSYAASYDHGHLCPCADRNKSQTDVDSTYYMTNILPQIRHYNRTLLHLGPLL